jgi:hypothetical protein
MEKLPPLVLGDFVHVPKEKPNLLVLPSGDVMEFHTLESAVSYLETARRAKARDAEAAAVFFLQNGQWTRHE